MYVRLPPLALKAGHLSGSTIRWDIYDMCLWHVPQRVVWLARPLVYLAVQCNFFTAAVQMQVFMFRCENVVGL